MGVDAGAWGVHDPSGAVGPARFGVRCPDVASVRSGQGTSSGGRSRRSELAGAFEDCSSRGPGRLAARPPGSARSRPFHRGRGRGRRRARPPRTPARWSRSPHGRRGARSWLGCARWPCRWRGRSGPRDPHGDVPDASGCGVDQHAVASSTPAVSTRACQAVRATSGTAAATGRLMRSGTGTRARAGARTYSAAAPWPAG